jgi:hypothetical protein
MREETMRASAFTIWAAAAAVAIVATVNTATPAYAADITLPTDGSHHEITTSGPTAEAEFVVGDTGRHVIATCEVTSTGEGYWHDAVLLDPAGQVLTGNLCAARHWIEAQQLTERGVYKLRVVHRRDAPFTAVFSVRVVTDVVLSGARDGAELPFTPTAPGQDGYVSFAAQAGDRLRATCKATGSGQLVTLVDPRGRTRPSWSGFCYTGDVFDETLILPEDGTYTLFLDNSPMVGYRAVLRLFSF